MSSPPKLSSPLAEALANEDIAFSSPEALRALPLGSSWPPRLPTEVAWPSRNRKSKGDANRMSKLLPGEKDPQPAFCSPRKEEASKATSPGLSRGHDADKGNSKEASHTDELANIVGPFRHHDAAALRSPTGLSSVVAGPFRRHNAAAAERSKQLLPALGRKRSYDLVTAYHGQSTAQTTLTPVDLGPLHCGSSWPSSQTPSSPSSSESWVTARGEEERFQEPDEEGRGRREEGEERTEEANREREEGEEEFRGAKRRACGNR